MFIYKNESNISLRSSISNLTNLMLVSLGEQNIPQAPKLYSTPPRTTREIEIQETKPTEADQSHPPPLENEKHPITLTFKNLTYSVQMKAKKESKPLQFN